MGAIDLYRHLHTAGLGLSTDGQKLTVIHADRMNDEQRAGIRQHKKALIEYLISIEDQVEKSLAIPTTPQHTPHQYGITFSAQLKGPVPAPGQHPANTGPAPEHPAAVAWQALDKAYQAHHFKCAICIAAGRGVRYGLRCGTGAALWTAYSEAGQQPGALPWHQPKKGLRRD